MERTSPPIIGLAGGIGSGKSTIARCFNKLGIQSVDVDDIARLVVKPGTPCLSAIREHFGEKVIQEDGSLNRSVLRKIIFDVPEERVWLESLTHPAIREETFKQLSNASSEYVLLVHPLLFETQQNKQCYRVIAIDTTEQVQLERVTLRDNVSVESAKKILAAQLSNEERLKRADYQLENSGTLDNMNDKVLKIHQKVLESIHVK
ncbi:dephospho-CoA kinase [Marinomonas algarum]|uniref:Dephospho-CoA kinase n=1 Tax=Marinomonas algarum TaxID=2883105 RepID=A0A9X1IPQ0_9GAMM|nr:dephospho-CoA kinase [Marinomonas algarum]MCB5162769.1 dephospho-CoA kinase [Marinomonas algarum]